MFEWAYSGVDHSIPGAGGPECVDFIPLWQRIAESGLACVFAAFAINFAYKRVTLPEKLPPPEKSDNCGKRVLLVTMCLTFGIEVGFKLATRQLIWIFNPCHITSMIQIFILAAPPSKLVTAMFRLHLHMLTGAPIAILLPVINTRLLTFETEIYFIQHTLMIIIPYYLIKIGGVYTPEKLGDMSWAFLSLGWLYFFHFVPLNYLAVVSEVNLNNMLCPAVTDPFYGRLYRLCAMTHQIILIPLIGKVIVATSQYFKILRPSGDREILVFVQKKEPSFCSRTETDTNVSDKKSVDDDNINRLLLEDPSSAVRHRNGVSSQQKEENRGLHSEREGNIRYSNGNGNGHAI